MHLVRLRQTKDYPSGESIYALHLWLGHHLSCSSINLQCYLPGRQSYYHTMFSIPVESFASRCHANWSVWVVTISALWIAYWAQLNTWYYTFVQTLIGFTFLSTIYFTHCSHEISILVRYPVMFTKPWRQSYRLIMINCFMVLCSHKTNVTTLLEVPLLIDTKSIITACWCTDPQIFLMKDE